MKKNKRKNLKDQLIWKNLKSKFLNLTKNKKKKKKRESKNLKLKQNKVNHFYWIQLMEQLNKKLKS